MLNNDYTTQLLDLEEVIIKKVEKDAESLCIHIELPKKEHHCPDCNAATTYVHDYRYQRIKDIPFGRRTTLLLRKRRYCCPCCGKRFYEDNSFLGRYRRATKRMIERLVRSVTAVRMQEGGWLYPAFRKNALSVIDNVFRAKIEQGLWMVAHPVVLYDGELLNHCVNKLHTLIDKSYISDVFSIGALGKDGVELAGKKYFLLSDIDIGADLRRFYHSEPLFCELYERQARRHPIWKSYYEYRYLFSNKANSISEEDVFVFFKSLIDYLKSFDIFVLDENEYKKLIADSEASNLAKRAAMFLYEFFTRNKLNFNIVLLTSTNSFSPKFNPELIYILFNNLPKRNGKNYETYRFLKDSDIKDDNRHLFYLYPKDALSSEQLDELRTSLFSALLAQREKPRV